MTTTTKKAALAVKKPPAQTTATKPAAKKAAPAKKKPPAKAAAKKAAPATPAGDARDITDARLEWLPAHQLHPDPANPRQDLGDLTELAASIVQLGVLEPLIVTAHPTVRGEWQIVAGHRRHAAATLAGVMLVPAVIRVFDDVERRLAMLVENLHRRDLDPFDEARGYQMLVDLGLSQRDIAERVGCSQPHVSRRLKLRVLRKEIG